MMLTAKTRSTNDITPDQLAKLRLARTEGVGPITYNRLLARYPDPEQALAALPELAQLGGRTAPVIPHPARDAKREHDALRKLGGRMIFLGDPDYPPLLALLPDAPPILSILGDPAALHRRAVGLVGARNASANGQRMAEALATELATAGLVVVSGLARGIDAAAHIGALLTGQTVAAVAGGLDVAYPPEHTGLQEKIAAKGAVVSEAPLGTAPQSRHFPRRNRIIAGLSLGVVVVEAALRSGSLITARLAQDAHRELFAVPGSPLDPRCHGTNDLIRQGAHITESAADVLANLPDHPDRQGLARTPLFARAAAPGMAEPRTAAPWPEEDLGQVRAELARLLSPAPTAIDELIRRSQFPPGAVMGALVQLELGLRVEMLPGNRVCLLGKR
jgi:DNA processing protein